MVYIIAQIEPAVRLTALRQRIASAKLVPDALVVYSTKEMFAFNLSVVMIAMTTIAMNPEMRFVLEANLGVPSVSYGFC